MLTHRTNTPTFFFLSNRFDNDALDCSEHTIFHGIGVQEIHDNTTIQFQVDLIL